MVIEKLLTCPNPFVAVIDEIDCIIIDNIIKQICQAQFRQKLFIVWR